ARVAVVDHLTLLRLQPREAIDVWADMIHGVTGIRIDGRADTRTFRAEQAAIRPDGLDQQLQRRRGIEHRIEVKELEPVAKPRRAAPAQRGGIEAAQLIRDRATAMRRDDLQLREILEYVR